MKEWKLILDYDFSEENVKPDDIDIDGYTEFLFHTYALKHKGTGYSNMTVHIGDAVTSLVTSSTTTNNFHMMIHCKYNGLFWEQSSTEYGCINLASEDYQKPTVQDKRPYFFKLNPTNDKMTFENNLNQDAKHIISGNLKIYAR